MRVMRSPVLFMFTQNILSKSMQNYILRVQQFLYYALLFTHMYNGAQFSASLSIQK